MALYVWGANGAQQLGLDEEGKQIFEVRKVDAFAAEEITDFSAGEHHSLAVNEFGDVFAWGRGREGQLGLGREKEEIATPERVPALEGQIIVKTSCGDSHSLALSASGSVFMWGLVPEGRKGQSEEKIDQESISLAGMEQQDPLPQEQFNRHMDSIMQRRVESSYAQFETINGAAPVTENSKERERTVRVPSFSPQLCKSLNSYYIVSISAGFAHSMAITSTGTLLACGYNDSGQLGLGHRRNISTFVQVETLKDYCIYDVACGHQHSLACTSITETNASSGKLFSWGLGAFGQLGTGYITISYAPEEVPGMTEPVVSVAAGGHHSVTATASGRVYSFGHAEYGQHGVSQRAHDLNSGREYLSPKVQKYLDDNNIRISRVTCSAHSTFGLSWDNIMYSWGWNAFGVLGNGKVQLSVDPQPVDKLKDTSVSHIGAGANHAGAIAKARGSHYSLRYNRVFDQEEFIDLVFIVGGVERTELKAHRAIVATRNLYLKGLLDTMERVGEMDEHGKLVVDAFDDVDTALFMAFLLFLYTARVSIASHRRNALGELAKRMHQDDLEMECQAAWKRTTKRDAAAEDVALPFVQAMETLVLSPRYADVEFLWPNGEDYDVIPGHKAVLSQVDYFHTMFTGGFLEGSTQTLEVDTSQDIHRIPLQFMPHDGVTQDAFRLALGWIYTGSFKPIEQCDPNELMDVYVTASLLGLHVLENKCELHLASLLPQLDEASMKACLDFAMNFGAHRLATAAKSASEKREMKS